MKSKILLTSFQTWLPHQKSNASDELLAKIQKSDYSTDTDLFFLRNLPVNVELASQKVIFELERIQPNLVMCCGMAEKRKKLTIESNAFCQQECLYTSIDLVELIDKLTVTEISHNAGKFVCEGLYYQVLKYIQAKNKNMHCIFVHVPRFQEHEVDLILHDFHSIILKLASKLNN